MPAKRQRKQFKFWLNVLNPQEKYLADVIQWLTEQGEFVRSIRDGLRLIYDLRFQRNTESLLELFPDIRERLQVQTTAAPVGGAGGQSELAREIAAQIILQGGTPGYLMRSEATGKPKEIPSPKFELPVFDDDLDLPTIVTSANGTTDAGANLVSNLKGLYN